MHWKQTFIPRILQCISFHCMFKLRKLFSFFERNFWNRQVDKWTFYNINCRDLSRSNDLVSNFHCNDLTIIFPYILYWEDRSGNFDDCNRSLGCVNLMNPNIFISLFYTYSFSQQTGSGSTKNNNAHIQEHQRVCIQLLRVLFLKNDDMKIMCKRKRNASIFKS